MSVEADVGVVSRVHHMLVLYATAIRIVGALEYSLYQVQEPLEGGALYLQQGLMNAEKSGGNGETRCMACKDSGCRSRSRFSVEEHFVSQEFLRVVDQLHADPTEWYQHVVVSYFQDQ